MANTEHLAILLEDVDEWNSWRDINPQIRPDLSGADLSGEYLFEEDLSETELREAKLAEAYLYETGLILQYMNRANLSRTYLVSADLSGADLSGANLSGANLSGANLSGADLAGAYLTEVILIGANLDWANADGADLRRANMRQASLVGTSFANAILDGCNVFGVSAWNTKLDSATQTNLRITPPDEPEITVDNLEVAQFLYLLLHNQEIRSVIDTLTNKVVLLLGRFTPERKTVLDAIRDALRTHGYVPVLFDFSGPENRNITETVTLLARMARFIIADLTDPGSIPYELARIVPDVHVPVQPLLLESAKSFSLAGELWMAHEMLPVYRYRTPEDLLATLPERVISPAESKVEEIQRERVTANLRSGLP